MNQHSIGRNKAIELADSHWRELCSAREIAEFQLHVAELCMPFDALHQAMETALGRGVFSHQFANLERLAAELRGDLPAPTLDEIIALIPEEKRIVFTVPDA